MGYSSVGLMYLEKRFRVVLHGEEYIYELKYDLDEDYLEENIYHKKNGELIPVEDTEIRHRVREMVDSYDREPSRYRTAYILGSL